jgi:hypothetical protein
MGKGKNMRYIMLIYSQSPERELSERNYNAHWALMEEAGAKGALVAAEPLPPFHYQDRAARTGKRDHHRRSVCGNQRAACGLLYLRLPERERSAGMGAKDPARMLKCRGNRGVPFAGSAGEGSDRTRTGAHGLRWRNRFCWRCIIESTCRFPSKFVRFAQKSLS